MNRHLLHRMTAAAAVACAAWFVGTATSQAQGLTLVVDPSTGAVTISNQSFTNSLALDAYQITSESSSLVPDFTNTSNVGWDSLTDASIVGWEEVLPSASALSELNLTSSMSLMGGGSRSLGMAFTPSGTQDLVWGYSVAGETPTKPAAIAYTDTTYLQVIRLLGAANAVEGYAGVILNPSATSISLDAYAIRSAAGSLNPAGFNAFAGHGVAGWESVAPSASALSELNLTDSSTLAAGKQQTLGSLFTDTMPQDLTFQYHDLAAGTLSGSVLYKSVLSGDANEDGVVNIFDINLISSNWNTSGPAGDANYDGVVNIFDINAVSSHWNNTLAGGSSAAVAAVPEPSALVLCGIGICVGVCCIGRTRRTRRQQMSPVGLGSP
jgi:hypothetical protein